MSSNSKQTTRIRGRKKSKQGKSRKRALRRNGSTPSLSALLGEKPAEGGSKQP